jgi:hypothetical protein
MANVCRSRSPWFRSVDIEAIPTDPILDRIQAHFRIPVNVVVGGAAMSIVEASQASLMIPPRVAKTRFGRSLALRNCQMFSTGFSSAERDGCGMPGCVSA